MWLERGADINAIDKKGHGALVFATKEGDMGTLEFLIDMNVDLNAENNVLALYYASAWDLDGVVKLFLENGLKCYL